MPLNSVPVATEEQTREVKEHKADARGKDNRRSINARLCQLKEKVRIERPAAS
jgi:hypothetical protein